MFRWVGRQITRYAPIVVIVILLISLGFALVLPKVEFKTDWRRFLPDNELVRANDRVEEYFGDNFADNLRHPAPNYQNNQRNNNTHAARSGPIL